MPQRLPAPQEPQHGRQKVAARLAHPLGCTRPNRFVKSRLQNIACGKTVRTMPKLPQTGPPEGIRLGRLSFRPHAASAQVWRSGSDMRRNAALLGVCGQCGPTDCLVHRTAFTGKSKETKGPAFGVRMDRSSSLVWMTHSHCVRRNPARVVGPNPTRSIFIQHVEVLAAYFVPERCDPLSVHNWY